MKNNGQKTREQHRGQVLAKRVRIINDFVEAQAGTDIPFGAFMQARGITKDAFFSELPSELHYDDIGTETAGSEDLLAYGGALNALYHAEHVNHLLKTAGHSADGVDLRSAVVSGDSYSGYYDASGKWKKKWKSITKKVENKVKNTIEKTKGKVQGIADKIKKQGIIGTLNKANPQMLAMRGAFDALLVGNVFNLAGNLGRMKDKGGKPWEKIIKKWRIVGGDSAKFESIIQVNRNKKPILGKRKNADGNYSLTGIEEAGAFIAQAAPFLAVVLPAINQFKKSRGEEVVPEEDPGLPYAPPLDPQTQEALNDADADPDSEESFYEMYKIPIWIGASLAGAAIVGTVIYIAVKSSK